MLILAYNVISYLMHSFILSLVLFFAVQAPLPLQTPGSSDALTIATHDTKNEPPTKPGNQSEKTRQA